MPTITLRDSTLSDIQLLEYWDTLPHVMSSDPDSDWNWDVEIPRKMPWREQLIAELNGKPIGFVQIIDPELEDSHYWGECDTGLRAIDIWIGEAGMLGKGYGTQMMKLALARCFEPAEVTAVIIDPLATNQRAIKFYQRLGYEFVEDRWFDEDHCAVHKLSRQCWQTTLA